MEFKTDELKKYAHLLIENGFRVFVYDNKEQHYKISWLIIEKDNNIGYIQLNDFLSFDFTTVHKANRKTGTGFKLNNNNVLVWNPTIENALKTFVMYPIWAKDKNSVIKYKNIDEYLKSSYSLNYIEVLK